MREREPMTQTMTASQVRQEWGKLLKRSSVEPPILGPLDGERLPARVAQFFELGASGIERIPKLALRSRSDGKLLGRGPPALLVLEVVVPVVPVTSPGGLHLHSCCCTRPLGNHYRAAAMLPFDQPVVTQ